jgi:hypothetical protein
MNARFMVFMILISSLVIASADFCERLVDEHADLLCPKEVNIVDEVSKPDNEYRLDFQVKYHLSL